MKFLAPLALLTTVSLASMPLLVNIMIYLVLVPILVFFFLKDRAVIGRWVRGFDLAVYIHGLAR